MDINSKKAVIMMATYNGEKYIRDQIKSLQDQTFTNWELFISDDGSSDKTIKILQEFQSKDSRIKKIIHNTSKYHGAYANYFNIMNYVKMNCVNYDYYFYCDQDDIWLKTRIEKEIISLLSIEKQYGISTPAFVYCDLELCDKDCVSTHDKMSNHIRTQFVDNPYNSFFKEQYVWGTSMAHNQALWNLIYIGSLKKIKNILTHDGYVSKFAAAYAKIHYISESLILYRRTGENISDTPGEYNIITQKIFKLSKIISNAANVYWDTLYFAYHAPVDNNIIHDIKKCFTTPLNTYIYIRKYNILKNERFLGKCSTKFILYFKLYKDTVFFKNNDYK